MYMLLDPSSRKQLPWCTTSLQHCFKYLLSSIYSIWWHEASESKASKTNFCSRDLFHSRFCLGYLTWKEWKTLQFRVKQASRRKINVRLGGSATLLVYFMFNDSGFRKKCCRYLHHSSNRHFYCRLMMILQELCKCFIMFHHLQISDMNSIKYFGMSLCTLELSVTFLLYDGLFLLYEGCIIHTGWCILYSLENLLPLCLLLSSFSGLCSSSSFNLIAFSDRFVSGSFASCTLLQYLLPGDAQCFLTFVCFWKIFSRVYCGGWIPPCYFPLPSTATPESHPTISFGLKPFSSLVVAFGSCAYSSVDSLCIL